MDAALNSGNWKIPSGRWIVFVLQPLILLDIHVHWQPNLSGNKCFKGNPFALSRGIGHQSTMAAILKLVIVSENSLVLQRANFLLAGVSDNSLDPLLVGIR